MKSIMAAIVLLLVQATSGGSVYFPALLPIVNEHLREHIFRAAILHDIDYRIVDAVITIESGGDTTAISYCGAIGPMQLMPSTATWLGVNPHVTSENISGGSMYLSDLIDQYGNLPVALAAYNAGPGSVAFYSGIPPFVETKRFIRSVTSIIGGDNGETARQNNTDQRGYVDNSVI